MLSTRTEILELQLVLGEVSVANRANLKLKISSSTASKTEFTSFAKFSRSRPNACERRKNLANIYSLGLQQAVQTSKSIISSSSSSPPSETISDNFRKFIFKPDSTQISKAMEKSRSSSITEYEMLLALNTTLTSIEITPNIDRIDLPSVFIGKIFMLPSATETVSKLLSSLFQEVCREALPFTLEAPEEKIEFIYVKILHNGMNGFTKISISELELLPGESSNSTIMDIVNETERDNMEAAVFGGDRTSPAVMTISFPMNSWYPSNTVGSKKGDIVIIDLDVNLRTSFQLGTHQEFEPLSISLLIGSEIVATCSLNSSASFSKNVSNLTSLAFKIVAPNLTIWKYDAKISSISNGINTSNDLNVSELEIQRLKIEFGGKLCITDVFSDSTSSMCVTSEIYGVGVAVGVEMNDDHGFYVLIVEISRHSQLELLSPGSPLISDLRRYAQLFCVDVGDSIFHDLEAYCEKMGHRLIVLSLNEFLERELSTYSECMQKKIDDFKIQKQECPLKVNTSKRKYEKKGKGLFFPLFLLLI